MSEIIRQIKQKTSSSSYSSPIYIGAFMQYVSALRQSNNANLEEQLVLGTDCITTESWGTENGKQVHNIIKEFHDGTKTNNFYKLTIKIYDEIPDFNISGTKLILELEDFEKSTSFKTIKTETLSYINNSGTEIKISVKTTQQKFVNGVLTTKETIKRENI